MTRAAPLKEVFYRLSGALQVQRQEAANLAVLGFLFFLANVGIALGRSARDAIFLVQAGAESLPYMYAGCAFFVVGASLLFGALLRAVHPRVLHPAVAVALSGLLLVGLLALRLRLPAAPVILYVLVQVAWIVSLIQLWNLVTEVFDPQVGKRIFPMIVNLGLLGMILAGWASALLAHHLGAPALVLAWALLLLPAAPLLSWVVRANRLARKAAEKGTRKRGALTEVRESGYFRLFCAATVLLWLASYLADYIFLKQVRDRHADPESLARFLGLFQYGLLGLATLLANVFLTGRIILHLGVAASAVVYPAVLTAALLAYALLGGFQAAAALKFADSLVFYTLHGAVCQLLYTPIPEALQAVSRNFLEGTLKPLSIAAAGLLIMAAQFAGLSPWLPWLALLVAALWTAVSFRQSRAYATALLGLLHGGGRILKAEAMEALRLSKDAGLYHRLLKEAGSPDAGRAVAALDFYEAVGGQQRLAQLDPLLRHPAPEVRARVLAWTAGELAAQRRLEAFLRDPGEEVVLAAMDALLERGGTQPETLASLKGDARPRVRLEAARQLALRKGPEAYRAELRAVMAAEGPAGRAFLLRRLAARGEPGFDGVLACALLSPDPEEFAAAAELACRPAYAAALDTAVAMLHEPERASAAGRILAAHGPAAFARLDEVEGPSWPDRRLRRWPGLILATGKAEGRDRVLRDLTGACPRIRLYRTRALVQAERDPPPTGADVEAYGRLLTRSIKEARRAARENAAMLSRWGSGQAGALLADVLAERFADLRTSCLHLLGLSHRRGGECLLLETQLARGARQRGAALETLENLVGRTRQLRELTDLYASQEPENLRGEEDLADRDPERAAGEILAHGLPWERWIVRLACGIRLEGVYAPMLNLDHYLFLQDVGLFADLRKEDIYSMAELTREAAYRPGDEIFHQGDEGNALFIIMQGEADILVDTADGARKVARLGEKQCFGEMALLDEENRSATVKAATPMSCLVLEKADFQHLLEERATLSREMIRILVKRLRQANQEKEAAARRSG